MPPEGGAAADVDKGHMHIGEVADRVRLSHRTIRYYDEAGLLVPARSSGNYRLFGEADVQRLLLIREMKPLGFSLEAMGELIAVLDALAVRPAPGQLLEKLSEFIATATRKRDQMAEDLKSADRWIVSLNELRSSAAEGPASA